MYCPNCGNKLPEGAVFCGFCGVKTGIASENAGHYKSSDKQTCNTSARNDAAGSCGVTGPDEAREAQGVSPVRKKSEKTQGRVGAKSTLKWLLAAAAAVVIILIAGFHVALPVASSGTDGTNSAASENDAYESYADTSGLGKVVTKGTCGDDLTWKLYKDGTIIISGTGEIDIYFKVDNDETTKYQLANLPFEVTPTRLIIEDGVTGIGEEAFSGCPFETVVMADSVLRIEDSAFAFCNVVNLVLSENLTYIGAQAFKYCTELTEVTVPESVTQIDGEAFADCSALVSITLPQGLTEISFALFRADANLKEVNIPEGVTQIGSDAFSLCYALETIEIPDAVTQIGTEAFFGCDSLKEIELPEGLTTLNEETFRSCDGLTEMVIPSTLTYIDEYVFKDCVSLETVYLPKAVEFIGYYTFEGCDSLFGRLL